LTLPSRGRPTSGFASCRPPLMSNVRAHTCPPTEQNMLELLRDFALKALGELVPFIVAWFYKPEKISASLKFRVQGHGDGVTYECGDLPSVRIWFLVSNLSPFKVEIDRLQAQVAYGAVIGVIVHIRKHTLS